MYQAINGQSIYDICLMNYGTFDLLYKLVSENMVSIDDPIVSGQQFTWDETLSVNPSVNTTLTNNNIILATL
jgi:hypothetical protein